MSIREEIPMLAGSKGVLNVLNEFGKPRFTHAAEADLLNKDGLDLRVLQRLYRELLESGD